MGNEASQLGDEPAAAIAQKNLHHFDHSFKAELHTTSGPVLTEIFGDCKFAKRPVLLTCKGAALHLVEEQGISSKIETNIYYGQISGIAWDHANSEVKLTFKSFDEQQQDGGEGQGIPVENFIILTMGNSIELEGELKLRLSAMAAHTKGARVPTPMYIGMFAGTSKPKPFQRKRPNLSNLPPGKLPPLQDMRSMAVDLHRGSYRPCTQGQSRRKEIALQHIYEGMNFFPLLNVRGPSALSNQYSTDSMLMVTEEALFFKPRGVSSDARVEFPFDDVADWNAVDNDNYRMNDSGVEIVMASTGESIYFGVEFVRDVKHTLEYFWNRYKVANGMASAVKLGSTHGRPIVTVATLSGDLPPPVESLHLTGYTEVVDHDGMAVRPGGQLAPRKKAGLSGAKELKVVPPENRIVKQHWHKVVMHQGWLLKKGGVGVGSIKSWIKRYFVLYKTSQGHFLVYYSDFTESPMYSPDQQNGRNYIDLAKCTFIRPGSNKQDNPDTPPHSFDIVTIEREWTLCAETQENEQRWLRLLTKAVDEDVAILPDEELMFKVKPKVDPLGVLPQTDYSTSLKVSAFGVSVCTPIPGSKDGSEREHYFWVYTDFYKWSLLSQAGKLALLVNVFADSSFSRRNEYIFRNKEAQRLATAIEFFIEKFMSLMHIRLETTPGAFDEASPALGNGSSAGAGGETELAGANTHKVGMHNLSPEEMMHADEAQELDLLGLEIEDNGNDMFAGAGATVTDNKSTIDPFTSSTHGSGSGTTPSAPAGGADSDLFGGDDPFGSDPFGSSAPVGSATPVKVAPPLTPQQIAQHRSWLIAAIGSGGESAFYDDGTLQASAKVEVRGSQARLTFSYCNQSPAALKDFQVSIADTSGLIRFELGASPTSVDGLARVTQTMMLECMKPAFPGPKVTFSYVDTLQGRRCATLDLPIIVTTFNEALRLNASDFMNRWQQLLGPGQEAQVILKPTYPVVPAQVLGALTTTLKFGRVEGLPDASDFVIYGAASLKTGALAPSGEKISVGCLAKIEMNVQSNALRVTLRTVHAAASKAILETAESLLL